MSVQLVHHRFTIDDYHAMAAAGVLKPDDRVELIEGVILDMTPIGSRHAAAVDSLIRLAHHGLRKPGHRPCARFCASTSTPSPGRIFSRSCRETTSIATSAAASGVLLLIRGRRELAVVRSPGQAPLYARAGAREAWLVDLVRDEVEAHREPGPEGFARSGRGAGLSPAAFPDLSLSIGELPG